MNAPWALEMAGRDGRRRVPGSWAKRTCSGSAGPAANEALPPPTCRWYTTVPCGVSVTTWVMPTSWASATSSSAPGGGQLGLHGVDPFGAEVAHQHRHSLPGRGCRTAPRRRAAPPRRPARGVAVHVLDAPDATVGLRERLPDRLALPRVVLGGARPRRTPVAARHRVGRALRADPLLVKAPGPGRALLRDDPIQAVGSVGNETYAPALDDPADGLGRATARRPRSRSTSSGTRPPRPCRAPAATSRRGGARRRRVRRRPARCTWTVFRLERTPVGPRSRPGAPTGRPRPRRSPRRLRLPRMPSSPTGCSPGTDGCPLSNRHRPLPVHTSTTTPRPAERWFGLTKFARILMDSTQRGVHRGDGCHACCDRREHAEPAAGGPRRRAGPRPPVRSITTAPSGFEGEGFPVRRAFAGLSHADLDPFVHMDQMGEVDYARASPRARRGTRTAASRPSPTSSTATFLHQDSTAAGADHRRRHPVDDRRRRHPAHRGAAGGARRQRRPVPRPAAVGQPAAPRTRWWRPATRTCGRRGRALRRRPTAVLAAGDRRRGGRPRGPGSTTRRSRWSTPRCRRAPSSTCRGTRASTPCVYVLAGRGTVGAEAGAVPRGPARRARRRRPHPRLGRVGRQDSRSRTLELYVLGWATHPRAGRAVRPFVMNTEAEIQQAFDGLPGRQARRHPRLMR